MEPCDEAIRLLDIYLSALTVFHETQTPLLRGVSLGHPEFHYLMQKKENAHTDLLRARHSYWRHVREHRCRAGAVT